MPQQPSLFDEPSSFDRTGLAAKVKALAERNIFIGTSSWRYEGWLGQVYSPERYFTRGRFSKQKFHDDCIREYAETFPIVGGDFSFYSVPDRSFWTKVFDPAPATLKWNLKVPEDFTAKRFSNQPRYGARAGQENPLFLDADSFRSEFIDPLGPYLDRIGVFLIEFGTFSKASYAEPKMFFDDLDCFLRQLPTGVRYSVEIRNDDYLDAAYFDVLKANGVAHTFNSWSRMPSLRQQIQIDEAFSAPFTVARALLRPGRPYADAVKLFSPYRAVKEPYPSARDALRQLIHHAQDGDITAFIHVNNRLEGNAIGTIAVVVAPKMLVDPLACRPRYLPVSEVAWCGLRNRKGERQWLRNTYFPSATSSKTKTVCTPGLWKP